jgi:type I restriction enzyme, S subunit
VIRHKHQTILGDIPDDWFARPLWSLLITDLSGEWGEDEGDVTLSVLRSTNFTDTGNLKLDDVAKRGFTRSKAEQIQVQPHDILVERSGGGPSQPVGRVAMIRNEMSTTGFANFVQMLRPDTAKISGELLLWILHQLNRSGIVERLQHQTTQMRNLDLRDYLKVLVPVPADVEEQTRIAETLKTADDHIRALEEQRQKAERVKTALLQTFPPSPRHGMGTSLHRVADINSGFTKGRDLAGHETVDVAYLTVVNVLEGRVDISDLSTTEVKLHEVERYGLRDGDILMTEGGDRDKVGRGSIWLGQIPRVVCQNHIFRVRLDTERFLPWFMHYLLQTFSAKRYFASRAKQSSNLCSINSREMRLFELPNLSIKKQEFWIERLRSADSAIEAIEAQLTAARRVKQSLLQNLLTGKIRLKA